tara:strand:- start:253 stop:528 length:276 start_codon:yes stop_codon:yes gene_type:complete
MASGMRIFLTIILTLSLFLLVTCEDNPECASCGGGLLEGFLFKKVTQDDLAEIGNIEGMNIGICIRYQLLGLTDEEFDLETIAFVDDCCCD